MGRVEQFPAWELAKVKAKENVIRNSQRQITQVLVALLMYMHHVKHAELALFIQTY